ncbi:hypothetical protein RRG08_011263 [Elysia crispata]|uniref:Uncharacterized protein n=1 Tax=Elysia crispata TaxID=231223 RepID=A0AAE0YNC6_9GAST|nr:hypothetical protein RRG08_011263 [Elysia crispata]
MTGWAVSPHQRRREPMFVTGDPGANVTVSVSRLVDQELFKLGQIRLDRVCHPWLCRLSSCISSVTSLQNWVSKLPHKLNRLNGSE